MKPLKIVGLIFVIFGAMGILSGTGPVWARWTLLILGLLAMSGKMIFAVGKK